MIPSKDKTQSLYGRKGGNALLGVSILKHCALSVLLALSWLLLTGFDLQAQEDKQTYRVMAVMMTKINDFTTWPNQDGKDKPKEVKVAILTDDHNKKAIFDEVLNKRNIRNVIWRVDHIRSLSEAEEFQYVFVDSEHRIASPEWHAKFKDKGILTFGESDASNCMFHFMIVDGRLQFNLDLEAARHAGVLLDPRMVRLAHKVKGKNK